MTIDKLAYVFEALANETRLQIIKLIRQERKAYCGELTEKLHLSQPAVSYHLNMLKTAGVLKAKNEGTKHCYELNVQFLKGLGLNFVNKL